MAKIIEFYVPRNFEKPLRSAGFGTGGIVIPISPSSVPDLLGLGDVGFQSDQRTCLAAR